MIFEIIHHGEPKPFQRPRFNGKFAFNDPVYKAYKDGLRDAIYAEHFASIPQDVPPSGDKARSRYLNMHRYNLTVHAYRSRNTGDVDNFLKTAMDALQDSGLIVDDSQIDRIEAEKFIDRVYPRIEIRLEQTQSEQSFSFE